MENRPVRISYLFSKIFSRAVLALALVLLPRLAWAQAQAQVQQTQNLGISLNITGGCTFAGGSTVIQLSPTQTLAANVDGSATVSMTCTPGLAYLVGIGAGNAGTVAARAMTLTMLNGHQVSNSTVTIPYGLYQDANYQEPWGNTSSTEEKETGTGTTQTLTVYAQVPASTTAQVGGYSDVVPIQISY